MREKKSLGLTLALAAGSLCACATPGDMTYRPAPQILPRHIRRIAVRPVLNKTPQFGLEDKLTRRILDEFLRDGQYAILPESSADGVVACTITRYILTPIQYDTVLTPTAYKLRIMLDIQFVDRTNNTILWEESNLEGILVYSASTLQGGLTEEQAREQIWDQLARDVTKRVIEGFGAVTGASQRAISGEPPPDEPRPVLPPKPVNPDPY